MGGGSGISNLHVVSSD
uniref:Uncharacterized protein n=1 Tax=Arundo donax TaxID=35708 RepID=A0A0A9FM79_ARUDO